MIKIVTWSLLLVLALNNVCFGKIECFLKNKNELGSIKITDIDKKCLIEINWTGNNLLAKLYNKEFQNKKQPIRIALVPYTCIPSLELGIFYSVTENGNSIYKLEHNNPVKYLLKILEWCKQQESDNQVFIFVGNKHYTLDINDIWNVGDQILEYLESLYK